MSLEVHAFENDMGARPTRKKTRIAERRENLVVSLSVSFVARAPRFDPHQKRTRWSLSNSLSTPIQNGRRIQIQMLQFVRARIGNTNRISTRHHPKRKTTTTTKGRRREKRETSSKTHLRTTFCVAQRGLCLLCSEN